MKVRRSMVAVVSLALAAGVVSAGTATADVAVEPHSTCNFTLGLNAARDQATVTLNAACAPGVGAWIRFRTNGASHGSTLTHLGSRIRNAGERSVASFNSSANHFAEHGFFT